MSAPAESLRPEALKAFWEWWAAAKDHVAAAIADGTLGSSPLVGYITTAVHNLHPDIAWELGPGRVAKHNLTLTPEGNLTLRRITEHWVRSAPPPDGTWEYYPSRRRTEPLLGLEIEGKRFAPDEFRVAHAFDTGRETFDVTLYHPEFARTNEKLTRQVLFLTMDEALGEDDVERWVGSLEAARNEPPGATNVSGFVSAVDAARTAVKGEQFSLAQGQTNDGRPVFLIVNLALKQIDHLDHVFHLAVVIPLREPDANGLTSKTEADGLNAAEDRLLAALGDNAVQIGRVTWGGRRELHLFVRDPAAADSVTGTWTRQASPWQPAHRIAYDPTWSAAKQGIYSMLARRHA